MKISHESPLFLLPQARKFNDYDYALVHLFDQIPEYYQFFVDAVKDGRHVILDNSVFELGTAFDPEKYIEWILKLNPTEFIIPDVLEDTIGTMDSALDFIEKYGDKVKHVNKIGVVQGTDYNELVQCYQYMNDVIKVDKIAISFDYSYYLDVCPHPNKWMGYTLGRVKVLSRMLEEGIIDVEKPHHLLGCALPVEFFFYREGFDWIDTIDTSSPIVHGLCDIVYEPGGIVNKQSIKLVDLINATPTLEQIEYINWNLSVFRSYCNGMGA